MRGKGKQERTIQKDATHEHAKQKHAKHDLTQSKIFQIIPVLPYEKFYYFSIAANNPRSPHSLWGGGITAIQKFVRTYLRFSLSVIKGF